MKKLIIALFAASLSGYVFADDVKSTAKMPESTKMHKHHHDKHHHKHHHDKHHHDMKEDKGAKKN